MKIVRTAAIIAANAHTAITLMGMRMSMEWRKYDIPAVIVLKHGGFHKRNAPKPREVKAVFELDLKAFVWMCIGGAGVIAVMMVLALCEISGRMSRIEEEMEDHDRLFVENWNKRQGEKGNE